MISHSSILWHDCLGITTCMGFGSPISRLVSGFFLVWGAFCADFTHPPYSCGARCRDLSGGSSHLFVLLSSRILSVGMRGEP
jgi:hypothetical protein